MPSPSLNKRDWRQKVLTPLVEKFPERQERFHTSSGQEIEAVYAPEDLDDFDYHASLGYPGEYPFTRGIQPAMYRGRLWTMRQYAGFASAEESNKRYRFLLSQGQTGLSIAFDLPTQIGYDSDHPVSQAEIGKVGVPISTLSDMEVLFQGIPLDKVSTSMTINSTAPVLLAMYVALAKKQGVKLAVLEGTVQNDVLKEYIARGTYTFPPRPSMRLATDIFAYCTEYLPRWNTISVGGYHIREAGASAAQEAAFALANGIAYVQAAVDAGLDVDAFAGRISWIFQTHNNFFEEVAKLRAIRRMWARIMKDRFGAKDPRSCMFRTHVQTGDSTLMAQQPLNNLVRATVQAMAAVLGGVQSLAVSCYDEALCLPSEESVQLSLRTQQILGYESGIGDTVDPLGGSYFMEHLTGQVEKEATEYIARIDSMGGAVAAIEQGYQQREIHEASYRYQQDVESGKRIIVGMNKFVFAAGKVPGVMKIDQQMVQSQLVRLAQVKQSRDNARVQATLAILKEVADSRENIMPAILECVETYASLGEVCDVLRSVFGTQKENLV
ncbi:MAG: methylmalonyl-CoA mutase [Chloroflexi bacterium]|nr:methylmalonyl-CoA mutase [Chloroflexota bacterium]